MRGSGDGASMQFSMLHFWHFFLIFISKIMPKGRNRVNHEFQLITIIFVVFNSLFILVDAASYLSFCTCDGNL